MSRDQREDLVAPLCRVSRAGLADGVGPRPSERVLMPGPTPGSGIDPLTNGARRRASRDRYAEIYGGEAVPAANPAIVDVPQRLGIGGGV